MKIAPECIPCLLNRLLFETDIVDHARAHQVMKEACAIFNSQLSPDINSAELATTLHKRTYEILGNNDPYKKLKALAMSMGIQLEAKANALIEQSSDKLRTAILCSIVGNVLDFGIEGALNDPGEFSTCFDAIYDEGLGHDDVDKFKQYLNEEAVILLFTDNCGEIVFDKLLCKELKKFGTRIILIVKGEPILSDATLADANQIEMSEVVDEIITTPDYAVGVNVKNLGPELERHLEDADLIICKGMANFEALSETNYKPIAYILRTKCSPVANALGLPKNINAVKLIE